MYQLLSQLGLKRPPAITTGLLAFMVLLYGLSFGFAVVDTLKLTPSALTSINLNRLSFYPCVHFNVIHLVLNLIALAPLLCDFELRNGTVRTGIVLNVLAVFPGIVYCLVTLALKDSTAVAGASGWVFSLLAYTSYKQSTVSPTVAVGGLFAVPTVALPLVVLLLTSLLLRGSSLLGHTIGLAFGYMLGLGFLNVLIEPTTHVVEWIEKKLNVGIQFLAYIVRFVEEVEARELRAAPHGELLPTSIAATGGPGHVLGAE